MNLVSNLQTLLIDRERRDKQLNNLLMRTMYFMLKFTISNHSTEIQFSKGAVFDYGLLKIKKTLMLYV